MANYVLVRGWLECSFEDVNKINDLVLEHWLLSDNYAVSLESAELYRNGWTFPQHPINWTSVIFFGADVKEPAVEFIFSCLSKIANSQCEVDGYFHVDYEEGEISKEWKIENGVLLSAPR